MEKLDEWNDDQKRMIIIAVGEGGYEFDPASDDPYGLDVDVYDMQNLKELAEYFVDEGLFGEIPDHLQHYIDYDAIARDLEVDYSEITIGNEHLVYRLG
jgi:antirestriction protein